MTQNHIRAKHNSHIVALGLKKFISADQKAKEILEEIRRQDAVSIACHPHHRTTRRMEIGTCYLWDHRKELADLVDVWEAANRDDLFSVTSLKHYPYVANSDFHKAEASLLVEDAGAVGEDLAGRQNRPQVQRRHRHHALPKSLVVSGFPPSPRLRRVSSTLAWFMRAAADSRTFHDPRPRHHQSGVGTVRRRGTGAERVEVADTHARAAGRERRRSD